MSKPQDHAGRADFSLVLGGPLYQMLLRAGILRPPLDRMKRRVIFLSVVAWAPLLILSALQGQALGGVEVPFIQDVEVQVRFLFALPLLIVAELVVHQRLAPAVGQFLERGIVREAERARFEEILASTRRWRNSVVVEVLLIVFVFTVGHTLWSQGLSLAAETWYARPTDAGPALSRAGLWYAWVSLPIFQLLLMRWYYRLVLWFSFLWRASRVDLDLVPTHPDRAGGLGFLAASIPAFAPLLVAQSAVVSGMIAGRIFHTGAKLPSFQMEIVAIFLFALFVVLGPLLVFLPNLLACKRQGLREYGLLANRYVRDFDRKWLRGGGPPDEPFVGSADVQSLADLAGSYDVVREMRAVPFGKDDVVQLAVITALPIAPLVLTVIPLHELLQRLLGAVL
jgi:hypothetical protein